MRGKKNMHREIQIKQFPIVTTHWWPKTQNERFVWENEQYLYRFLPLVHNHVQVIWVRTHIRCVTCVCARSGSRLTEGVSEAWCWGNCHRACHFWTVYSRIMMTSAPSMYPFHSSVTSQTHMPQLHPPHPAWLPPNHVKNNRSRNSLLRHDTDEKKKKKESYYDEGLVHE